MANTLIFFAEKNVIAKATHIFVAKISMYLKEKNVSSFCIAKAIHIFAAKISMYLKLPYLQQLASLVINKLVKLMML